MTDTAHADAISKRENDPLNLAADAPLLAAYLTARERQAAGLRAFHTPGHKGQTDLVGSVVDGDMALAGGVDTVKLTNDFLGAAERRAADLYGADVCRFSVGGSTHCNQSLALAIGVPGDVVIVSRTLHRSTLLGLVLAGLVPAWIEPEVDQVTGLPTGYAPAAVADALQRNPGAVAVLLTDPSYVGTFSDIPAHADVAHAAGVPLVVDAAWAAHFGFHPALPPSALAAGADAMITSAHKALPAYSQAAMLLAKTERLDAGRLHRAFEATHTTSPGGALMASIDAARALLEREGERLLGEIIDAVSTARDRLRAVTGVHVVEGPNVDAAKLTVSLSGTGAHGVAVEEDLIAAGVPPEMADRDTIVGMVTVADDASSIGRYTDELVASIERHRGTPRAEAGVAGWIVSPDQRVAPREAFFSAVETLPFDDAVDRVSAELVALYPPGVPVLAPGEAISAEALTVLRDARADGVRVAYAADPTLATLDVLR